MVRQLTLPLSHSRTGLRFAQDALTPRQLDVLTLLNQGLRPQAMADELGLSIATVRTALRDAYSRLGASGGIEALAHARALGLFADCSQARDGRV